MRRISRTLFGEIFSSAALGCVLFTSVLFLERSRDLFKFLVNHQGPAAQIAYLFALAIPAALPFAIPLGVLLGTLVALSRMASDGEITAMRAAGVPGRRLAPAVALAAALGMCAAGAATLWLTPWSVEELYRVQNQIVAGRLTAEIPAREFEERFPNTILYVTDADPAVAGETLRWRRVFLADLADSSAHGGIPSVTLASEALVAPDLEHNRIQLSLRNSSTYQATADPNRYDIQSAPHGDRALEAERPPVERPSRPTMQMDTAPLFRAAYGEPQADPQQRLEARIEFSQRLALPFACIVLALAGIPLGAGFRRGGKSAAVVLTVAAAFVYFIGLVSMVNLARQGALRPELAVWLPNAVFGSFGLAMLAQLERPHGRDYLDPAARLWSWLRRAPASARGRAVPLARMPRLPLLPQVIDTHLTSSFLFYCALWLASFVLMTLVFTFFELLSDIIRNQIPLPRVLTYLALLTPRLIYTFLPVSVLTSVLVVFGVLTKNNELTAFKACGVSVYRLTSPIFITSLLLSGALFAFNHYLVPEADRRQNAIRAEIKGRPAQTFFNPGRTWFWGLEDRIYFYRYFDTAANVMLGVNVFEIDSGTFTLKRHISAERARWEPSISAWVFQNGWSRDIQGNQFGQFDNFAGQARTFPELTETPDYFVKEVIQAQQMNYLELRDYIADLRQSGFETAPLEVQYFKKFSEPLFTLILAMVSAPFAFQAGNRGAMAGVGISLAIFIGYWSVGQVFEQVGNLSRLPAAIAAWSPNVLFSLASLYFLARVRT